MVPCCSVYSMLINLLPYVPTMSPGDADFVWGRTGVCRAAAQCVRAGQSPGWTPALGVWGSGALPAAEGRRATTSAGPEPTSQCKMIPCILMLCYQFKLVVSKPVKAPRTFSHKETLMWNLRKRWLCSTPFFPSGSDIPWSAAGGSGGHRGAGPADAGDDESEELSHAVPPCLRHAGPSASRCYTVTGQFSLCKLPEQAIELCMIFT